MFVVQIGAADGKQDAHRGIDEVYEGVVQKGWRAVLVEPHPAHFQKLQENYKGYESQVRCINVAIADYDGFIDFFDCELFGASTLIESVLARNDYHGGKTKHYDKITVECMRINALLGMVRNRLTMTPTNIPIPVADYLVIDAEGYDGYILEALDLTKYPIPKIRFEFAHIEHGEQQQAQLGRVCLKLIKAGYKLSHDKADIVAQK